MLNSDDPRDVDLAVEIVNKLPSNRRIIQLISWHESDSKWYRTRIIPPASYNRKSQINSKLLYFKRHPDE